MSSHHRVYVTVDGTDCRIMEPRPFSTDWFSHKFGGPGLRYEIAVAIKTGTIVWANGPYPCGLFPDIKIFNDVLRKKLDSDEKVLADDGYSGDNFQGHFNGDVILGRKLRARHETVNRRFKQFTILSTTFRHDLSLHSYCFHAVVNMTEIVLQSTNPLFEVL